MRPVAQSQLKFSRPTRVKSPFDTVTVALPALRLALFDFRRVTCCRLKTGLFGFFGWAIKNSGSDSVFQILYPKVSGRYRFRVLPDPNRPIPTLSIMHGLYLPVRLLSPRNDPGSSEPDSASEASEDSYTLEDLSLDEDEESLLVYDLSAYSRLHVSTNGSPNESFQVVPPQPQDVSRASVTRATASDVGRNVHGGLVLGAGPSSYVLCTKGIRVCRNTEKGPRNGDSGSSE